MQEPGRTLSTDGIDVVTTLRTQGTYPQDPTHRWLSRGFAKAVLTPAGVGVVCFEWTVPGRVEVRAWGPGSEWLTMRASDWLGLDDPMDGFDPGLHPMIADLWRRHGRFRLSRGGVIWQELALVLLGQRVTTKSAVGSWARLCRRWGEPAPGPFELLLPPTPEVVAGFDLGDFHSIEVERRRAEAMKLAARRSARLEEAATMSAPDALGRLTALPGLGVWTATSTITVSHGDPDTVVLRDHGLPTMVNYVFTGDERHLRADEGGDEVMLAHLEPWRGHRQRIVRLLFAAGVDVPRRGPKRANPDIRRL